MIQTLIFQNLYHLCACIFTDQCSAIHLFQKKSCFFGTNIILKTLGRFFGIKHLSLQDRLFKPKRTNLRINRIDAKQIDHHVRRRVVAENDHQRNQIHDCHLYIVVHVIKRSTGWHTVCAFYRDHRIRIQFSCFNSRECLGHHKEFDYAGRHQRLIGLILGGILTVQRTIIKTDFARQLF